jgi:hypothetical protein
MPEDYEPFHYDPDWCSRFWFFTTPNLGVSGPFSFEADAIMFAEIMYVGYQIANQAKRIWGLNASE